MLAWIPRLGRALAAAVVFSTSAAAQSPVVPPLEPVPPLPPLPPPPSPWDGSAGVGLTFNRGNTATTNLNLSAEATRKSHAGRLWKFKGLYLRGDTNGVRAIDRLSADGRHEYTLSPRVYGFAQVQYLADRFKAIDYLWAPGAGIGYKLFDGGRTTLHVDAGLGVKVEKSLPPPGRAAAGPQPQAQVDGDVTLSDKFELRLSEDAKVTQGFGALWSAGAFSDALYTISVALTTSVTARTQLKVEAIDSYSTRAPDEHAGGNDISVLTAFVYKF